MTLAAAGWFLIGFAAGVLAGVAFVVSMSLANLRRLQQDAQAEAHERDRKRFDNLRGGTE
jgi:hypothetical protein